MVAVWTPGMPRAVTAFWNSSLRWARISVRRLPRLASTLAIAVRILSHSARRRAAAYGGMSATAANSDTLSIKNDKVWSVTVAVR
jgi:hypothetical protein